MRMFLLPLVFAFYFSANHAQNHNILQAFTEYCPTSIDCLIDAPFNSTITDNTAQECCAQCSCQQDCGRFQSCCFEADNEMYTHAHGKECVDPLVGDRKNFEAIGGQGYVMVTQCIDRNESCKYKNGQLNVRPVESSTFEVYINDVCALCNNVTSFKYWGIRTISGGGAIYSFLHLEDDFQRYETIIFEPSSDYEFPKCYTSTSFVPVNTSRCLSDEYKQLCNDIYLPFFSDFKRYKNIFCFLCVTNRWFCEQAPGKMIPGRFSLLLDNTIDVKTLVNYFSREHFEGGKCGTQFIPHPAKVCKHCLLYVSFHLIVPFDLVLIRNSKNLFVLEG